MTKHVTLTEAAVRSAEAPQKGFVELRDGKVGGGVRIGKTARVFITGCRQMEICSLKWEYVKQTMNELPASKGGAIKVAKVQAFTDLLADIERIEGNPQG
ncbi:MAG TPA: hypothetical protein VHT04_02560, partial [Stellaceae bacterium]|nr:hypothetical protein [Stellaceae bacterium]